MSSSFKTFLKFAANAALVLVLVGVVAPSIYKATKKVPPSIAAITALTKVENVNASSLNVLVLTFNEALPAPTATCDLDAGGASGNSTNTCYNMNANGVIFGGVGFYDGDQVTQRGLYYIARGTEWTAARSAGSFTSSQAVILIDNGSGGTITAGSGDSVTLGPANFTGATAVAGRFYPFDCGNPTPACAGVAGNGVENLQLKDVDSTASGLDGRDFKLVWTPKGTVPSGYTGTKFYIVPTSNATIAANNVATNGCGGSACTDVGFLAQYQANEWILPQFFQKDSHGTNWSGSTDYKVCIFIDAASDVLDCSPALRATSDTVTDATATSIDHISAFSYISGGELIVYAMITDDQTTDAEFQAGTNGANIQMFHDGTTQNVVTAAGQASKVANTPNVWRFETNTALSRNMKYYLKVRDKAGNIRFFTTNPTLDMSPATTDEQAAGAAMTVNAVAAGAIGLSGNVKDNTASSNINGAFVFISGLGVAGITTDASGNYSFSNLPAGSYDIAVAKDAYCDEARFETVAATKTGVDIRLNPGTCTFFSGGGGGGGKPHVMFSFPPQGDNFAPINQPLRVGFDQALSAGTVNDADASNAGSNVYLTANGSDKIAGRVDYCASQSSAGCSALPPGDTNVIVFTPTSSLTASTFYTLVIGSGVTAESGQSVEGNRAGGGHELNFSAGTAGFDNFTAIGASFGTGGQFMPPFVESMLPAPGIKVTPGAKILLKFNEAMNTATINTTNVKLFKGASQQTISVSVDANDRRSVTITPSPALTTGDYELKVLGAVSNSAGVPMRSDTNAGADAFVSKFSVAGTADTTPPSLFPTYQDGATGVPVNDGFFSFGFDEALDPSTITNTNVTLQRGSTSVSASVSYDSGSNTCYVIPSTVLAPNTNYTVTFDTDVKNISGIPLASSKTFTFTTSGTLDTTQARFKEARCDDYSCTLFFTEPMNNDAPAGAAYVNSVINPANYTLTHGPAGNPTQNSINLSGKAMTYDPKTFSVTVEGLTIPKGNDFRVTVTAVKDLSGNNILTAESANQFTGFTEDSSKTFGSFTGGGMFAPPTAGMGGVGGKFDMAATGGFGSFTPQDFLFGEALTAFPFNQTAGIDGNVFQIKIPMSKVGFAPVDADQFLITFPKGTGLANVKPDTFSPFYGDFNQGEPGKINFDATFDGDGVQVDTAASTVTVKIDVSDGTPTSNDFLTIDLRGITNPAIPKGPDSGGYTVSVKLVRSGTTKATVTSMPYFINAGGSNTIILNVYAGSQSNPVTGANGAGTVQIFGGGPSGEMSKTLTLANGVISAVDGASATNVTYSSLNNGCYFFGTDPSLTLGSADYFGSDVPEPICVNGGESKTKNIVFTAAAGGNSVPVTVKLVKSGGFGGADIDIFAGGPGRFVVKTLSSVNSPDASGYTLNLPANGFWNVGVGPAMPKGPSAGPPNFEAFGGTPPPPFGLEVDINASNKVKAGLFTTSGVAFNDTTDTITFTVKTNGISVPVQVTNGTSGLSNVDVFMRQQGFGSGAFGTTDKSGNVTLKVAEYGPYEIGAFKQGLGDTMKAIEVRSVNSVAKIFVNGSEVSTVPLKIAQPAFTISGKVLDASSKPIANAPIWGESSGNSSVHGMSTSDGSYSLGVPAGTWTIKAMLPPDKTDACGTFSKTVTVTTESKANENIEPSTSTCYDVSGTVTVGGAAQGNKFVHIEQWDTTNNRPSGGFFRGTSTNSSGVYSVKLPAGTYRFNTFDPSYGEVTTTYTISAAKTDAHINSGTLGTVTFAFTGGTADMNGFIELKKANDKNTRLGKPFNGATSNVAISVPEGSYNYFVNIFGVGDFTGTASTGSTVTITPGAALVTLSGTVKDATGTVVSKAKVSLNDYTNGISRDVDTDDSGNYSVKVKPGTYEVTAGRTGFVAGQAPTNVSLSADTTAYDFGGAAPDQSAMVTSDKTITGTVYKSDGSTPMTDAVVWAEDSKGHVVKTEVDAVTGAYTLPVTSDISWTVKSSGPLHDSTALAATVNTSDATADTGKNITLAADATNIPVASSTTMTVSTGGTFDETDTMDMKMLAPASVLTSNGATQGDVTVTMEKSYVAPTTSQFQPMDGVSFDLAITDSNNQAIKDLAGNVELTFEYDPTKLPTGTKESDIIVAYYNTEAGKYVTCEGGVTVDEGNNTATCVVSHATTFIVATPPSSKVASASSGSSYSRAGVSVTETTGGGAVPSVDTVNTVANTSTTAIPNKVRGTLSASATFAKPLTLEGNVLTRNADGTKIAALTDNDAVLTLKPSEEATIKVEIPASTSVTGAKGWTGDIQPPLVQPKTVVRETADYEVEGGRRTLTRAEVEAVVKVGSSTATLTFSAPVKVTVPVNLANGRVVEVYTSEDGAVWEKVDTGMVVVSNFQVAFMTTHMSYFAVVPTIQNVMEPETTDVREVADEVTEVTLPFTDVQNHWSAPYVSKLYSLGIVSGKTPTRFAPNDSVTRAELSKMAVLAFGYDVPGSVTVKPFKDVSTNAWYAAYIETAKREGIIKGYSSGHFKPDQPVNRAEALKILLEAGNVDVSGAGTTSFKDVSSKAWYATYVSFAKSKDIVSGYANNTFGPANYITRAEAAKMIVKIMEQ